MTNEQKQDMSALKVLAEAATAGPWTIKIKEDPSGTGMSYDVMAGDEHLFDDEQYYPTAPSFDDARFIAAANPAEVLRMIAHIEQLDAQLAELRIANASYESRIKSMGESLEEASKDEERLNWIETNNHVVGKAPSGSWAVFSNSVSSTMIYGESIRAAIDAAISTPKG